jgi:type VI secretion system protein ImpB
MVGNYTFKERDPDDILSDREKISINQRNFNEVMRKQGLGLNFNVANRLAAEEGEEMSVNLKIEDLNSFRPEAVASQVEELSTIVEIRNLLLALKSHVVSRRQFRRELEQLVKGDLDSALKEFAKLGYLPDESEEEGEAESSDQ